MTLFGEPRVWLEQFPLGEPAAFSHEHQGVSYPGEVLRAGKWSPEWGHPLEGEVYFRIVLLQQRRGGLRPVIQDPRIAVCLPAAGLSRRRGRLAGELSATRETQAVYLTQRDTEADLIRRTLQRRLEGLEEQLLGEESGRYSEGDVMTGGGRQPDPVHLFSGLDPMAWFSRLAGGLLAGAYPALPLNDSESPRPIVERDPAAVYRAIFGQPGAAPDVLEQFGPLLGLSDAAAPAAFDPSSCRVLELVCRRLSVQSGQAGPHRWEDVHQYLAHQVGLTGPLATLFLLVYLHCEWPELAVDLSLSHQLALVGERPLLRNRFTPDLIPALVWDDRIAGWSRTIGPVTDPAWNDALQHLSALSPGLAAIGEGDDFTPQEQALLNGLGTMGQELAQAQELLDLLGRAQGLLGQMGRVVEGDPETTDMAGALSRLSRISGDSFQAIYHSVRSAYPDHRRLEADIALLRRMAELGRSTEEILRAQEYLEGAVVPSGRFPSLSVDRQAMQAALSPASLVGSRGRGWLVLHQDISRFKARFSASYRTHHESVHRGLPLYRKDLDSARRKLAALELLNTLPELGGPAGGALNQALAELDPGPSPCPVPAADLRLESVPWCDSCRLNLEQSLPTAQLARLLAAIDVNLGAKNRRLSGLLVERILQGYTDERLDDFLKIVQASDLSALSDTLTPEVVAFIQRMLA